jgi:hypothetical protein
VLCLFESSSLVAGVFILEGWTLFFLSLFFGVCVFGGGGGSLHHLCFICSHIKHCYLPQTCYVHYVSYVPESVMQ